jgi:ubiquinone/menaquinone biosynthesis C-methylase UbiE
MKDVEEKSICPWQIVPLFDNYFRRFVHDPCKLFGPYVREGMTVLDIGCGAGFASLGLAELVGDDGLVISADVQPQMLDKVKKRAARLGLDRRIRLHRCSANSIGIDTPVDFALAFFMFHEVPDSVSFLKEVHTLLKPGGLFFLTEPIVHVSEDKFNQAIETAQSVGFSIQERPRVRIGRTVLLVKNR